MIEFTGGRRIAVMDATDQPVAKLENTLRIANMFIDYIKREARFVLLRGFQNEDKTFSVSNNEAIVLTLKDEQGKDLFTRLITPKENEKDRWAGDFRLIDIEQIIIDEGIFPELQEKIIKEQK